jgi:SRSO17 transposase
LWVIERQAERLQLDRRRGGKGYALGVKSDHIFRSYNENNQGLWTRGMPIQRNIADGDLGYFTAWCPAGT